MCQFLYECANPCVPLNHFFIFVASDNPDELADFDGFEPGTNDYVNLGLFSDPISTYKMFSSEGMCMKLLHRTSMVNSSTDFPFSSFIGFP